MSTTADLWNAIASSTGQLIDDSWPLWYAVLGIFFSLFALMLIVSAFRWITHKTIKVVK